MKAPSFRPNLRHSFRCHGFVWGFAVALFLATPGARADGGVRLGVEWGKIASFLRTGDTSLAFEQWRREDDERASAPRPAEDLAWEELRWMGSSPRLELIARDWGDARGLVGHLALTDVLRLSRSCRMVVARIRLGEGRLTPFAQVGLGQWRVDTDLMPAVARDVETAVQFGGGLELSLLRNSMLNAALALEVDSTMLYREQHEPQMIFPAQLLGALVAARVNF